MAATQREPTRPSRVVPLLVALIGAAGVVFAAWIARDGDSSNETETVSGPVAEEGSGAPDIAGRYLLDPDNPRIIILRSIGVDTYTIQEEMPAPWPFEGTVKWTTEGTFRGKATFASGSEMWVILDPQPDGSLDTTFDYITDSNGQLTDRVDPHLLVPE